MREARINIDVEGITIHREVGPYLPAKEQKAILSVAYREIKEFVAEKHGWLASKFVPADHVQLMKTIVEVCNKHFGWQDGEDDPIDTWGEFKPWAIDRGFLTIKELPEA